MGEDDKNPVMEDGLATAKIEAIRDFSDSANQMATALDGFSKSADDMADASETLASAMQSVATWLRRGVLYGSMLGGLLLIGILLLYLKLDALQAGTALIG